MTDKKSLSDCKLFVDFPLRGEWSAVNTPGDKIPSHGTDSLGQRYAYDFLITEQGSKLKFYKSSILKYRTIGVALADCYCYRKPVYSPVSGRVVTVKDGVKEPNRLHPVLDLLKVILRMVKVSAIGLFVPAGKIELHKFIGNYIIIKFDDHYAFFAHLVPGSIRVKEGAQVEAGELIAEVGHSGNSTSPHLHFHIMDTGDLLKAKGVFCGFKKYRIKKDDVQEDVVNGIPGSDQIIRY
ncbi:MAG: M23 family metallopeptidase [Spirochaetes bacterium]|nr:M23 family metallopeptidase [Spirochaetota bacterium]MBN2771228.1 M23 family metallopeptidase [Spirochaetota bacterium]